MPIEIIRRMDGEKSTRQEIRHEHTQFSINSYGHLCIREFDAPQQGHTCEFGEFKNCTNKEVVDAKRCCGFGCSRYKSTMMPGEDHLIVLNQKTTDGLIKFIFENRSTFELRELLKDIVKSNLPF